MSTPSKLQKVNSWASSQISAFSHVLLVILSLAAIVILLLLTSGGGLAVSADSVSYIASSQNLLTGHGFTRYEGWPYVSWPPLYPVFIALVSVLGRVFDVAPIEMLRYAHAVLFAAVVYTSGRAFFVVLKSRLLGVLVAVAVVCGFPVFDVATTVWSELLFLFLVNLFVLWAIRLRESPTWAGVLILSLLACLLNLQRYVGVLFVGIGLIWVIGLPGASRSRRLAMASTLVLSSSIPLVLWLIRNYQLTTTFTGTRIASTRSLGDSLTMTITTLVEWFVPKETVGTIRSLDGLSLFILCILTAPLIIEFFRTKGGKGTSRLVSLLLVWGTTITYGLLLAILATYGDSDPNGIGTRQVMPVYVLVLTLVAALVEEVSTWLASRVKGTHRGTAVAACLIVIWLLVPITRLSDEADGYYRDCCGYEIWRNQPLIVWLRSSAVEGTYYTNVPLPLYFGRIITEIPQNLGEWVAGLSYLTDEGYIVWFDNTTSLACVPDNRCFRTNYTVDDLSDIMDLELLFSLEGGRVYSFHTIANN